MSDLFRSGLRAIGRRHRQSWKRSFEKIRQMNQFRVSPGARSDLDEIWFYIAQDNPEAADKLIQAIVLRFLKLAAMPELGRSREELSPRLRSFPVGRHVILSS